MQSGTGSDKKSALHLWCAYGDDLLHEEAAQACISLLSEEERARWHRFRIERGRRNYLAAHALARNALSHHGVLAPRDWRFVANAHGKPAPDPECGLRFNLSHSGGLAVCLVSEGNVEVGVDVEPFERAEQVAGVAHKVFSGREQAQLESLPDSQRFDRLLSLWTLKEAFAKARGVGLSLGLDRISFVFEDGERGRSKVRLELDPSLNDDAGRWRFALLDLAKHRVAMVAETTAADELDVWEARPPAAVGVRLAVPAVAWFPQPAL